MGKFVRKNEFVYFQLVLNVSAGVITPLQTHPGWVFQEKQKTKIIKEVIIISIVHQKEIIKEIQFTKA